MKSCEFAFIRELWCWTVCGVSERPVPVWGMRVDAADSYQVVIFAGQGVSQHGDCATQHRPHHPPVTQAGSWLHHPCQLPWPLRTPSWQPPDATHRTPGISGRDYYLYLAAHWPPPTVMSRFYCAPTQGPLVLQDPAPTHTMGGFLICGTCHRPHLEDRVLSGRRHTQPSSYHFF